MALIRVTRTTKEEESLLIFNYRYYFKRENESEKSKHYVCLFKYENNKRCCASVTIKDDEIVKMGGKLVKENIDFDSIKRTHKNEHEPLSEKEIREIEFKQVLKDRAGAENIPVQQIYQEEQSRVMKELADINKVATEIPQFYNCQSAMYDHRSKFMPPIPDSVEDIEIEGIWAKCEDGNSRFLLHHDVNIIMFCSEVGLNALSKSHRWQADGTFSITPPGFMQLYIIHAYYKYQMIPCVFALLTGKSETLYKRMIQTLKDGALNSKLELKPKTIMVDFERAAINAFEYHFPNANLSGCFFHLGQSFHKKIVELNLKVFYDDNTFDLKTWVGKVIALALIPVDKVDDVWIELLDGVPIAVDSAAATAFNENVTKFCDYVTENYIDTDLFPKPLWNQYEAEKRTNNDCEGYNSKLSKFLNSHPNIWRFIIKIQSEETTASLLFIRTEKEILRERGRNKGDIERDLEIQTVKCKYLSNQIDILQYLNDISCVIHDYSIDGRKRKKNRNNKHKV